MPHRRQAAASTAASVTRRSVCARSPGRRAACSSAMTAMRSLLLATSRHTRRRVRLPPKQGLTWRYDSPVRGGEASSGGSSASGSMRLADGPRQFELALVPVLAPEPVQCALTTQPRA